MRTSYTLLITFVFSGFTLAGYSQANFKSKNFSVTHQATVEVDAITVDWNPVLQSLEMPAPHPGTERALLKQRKDELVKRYPEKHNASAWKANTEPLDTPFTYLSFVGNAFTTGTPNDNDIAISKDSMVVSVMNSTVYIYDIGTSTKKLKSFSLDGFTATLGNKNRKYDPKVLYDPTADRFIVACLAGFTDTATNAILAFSQTNNPSGTWNLYQLEGNPFKEKTWTDFPMLGLSEKELFLTVNFVRTDEPWQTGFDQTVIWQIDKQSGYLGDSLKTTLLYDINYNNRAIRNLCPVRAGSKLYDQDGFLFLSNRNFDAGNDTIFLVHVTKSLADTNQNVLVKELLSDVEYFLSPDVPQGIKDSLATNDSRVLGAFIENDLIQFVQNCLDTTNGRSGIYYGTIANPFTGPVLKGMVISDSLVHMGYPNIGYAGKSSDDHTAIVVVNVADKSFKPGVACFKLDEKGNHSVLKIIKKGEGFINVLQGNQERWGDYTGIQTWYHSPGNIWLSGMYGLSSGQHRTWIAGLSIEKMAVGIADNIFASSTPVTISPVPFTNDISIEFKLGKPANLTFEILDISGKKVVLLMSDLVKGGYNRFSFRSESLAPGLYFLTVYDRDAASIIASQKIVKQ